MKLSEFIVAMLKIDAAKDIATKFQTELNGGDVEAAELAPTLARARADAETATTLRTQVADLEPKAKGADKLKETLAARDGVLRNHHLAAAFRANGKAHGLKETAVTAALKLADTSKVQVNLDTGEVTGLTKEVFDGVKTQCPDIFEAPKTGAALNAPGQVSTSAVNTDAVPEVGGAIGHFLKGAAIRAQQK